MDHKRTEPCLDIDLANYSMDEDVVLDSDEEANKNFSQIYNVKYPEVNGNSDSNSLISVQCSLSNNFSSDEENLCFANMPLNDLNPISNDKTVSSLRITQMEQEMNADSLEATKDEPANAEEEEPIDLSLDPFQVVKPDENQKFFQSSQDWIKTKNLDGDGPPQVPPMPSRPPPPPPPPSLESTKSKNKPISQLKEFMNIKSDSAFGFNNHFDKIRLLPDPVKGIKNLINPKKKEVRQKLREQRELEQIIRKAPPSKTKENNSQGKKADLEQFDEINKRIEATITDSKSQVSALLLKSTEPAEEVQETGWAVELENTKPNSLVTGEPTISSEENTQGWADFSNSGQVFPEIADNPVSSDWAKDCVKVELKPSLEFQRDNWASEFPAVKPKSNKSPIKLKRKTSKKVKEPKILFEEETLRDSLNLETLPGCGKTNESVTFTADWDSAFN